MVSARGECWVITDGAAGNERQALALADTVGMPVRALTLIPRAPWSWAAPRLLPAALLALPAAQRGQFQPPWPTLAIGCGRAAAFFTRLLRQLSDERSFVVQILDPRIDPCYWDLVVAPAHDRLETGNTLSLLGSLNPVDKTWLAAGRESCPHLGDLPGPRWAVLLGGERRGIAFDDAYTRTMIARLRAAWRADGGGSIMITASRRTPRAFRDAIFSAFADIPGHRWNGQHEGRNPYAGYLGWADRIVVTPDSVNMLSEACATGKPVQTLITSPLPEKLREFHEELHRRGLLTELGDVSPSAIVPLRETTRVGTILRERMATRMTRVFS